MNTNLPDEEILQLSLKDSSYFSILVERYETPFIRKALSIVRGQEEAEDIVQEALIKIYRYGSKFKKQSGIEFKSWAYKILMNTAFTHYHKLKKNWENTEYLETLLYDGEEKKPMAVNEDIAAISDAKSEVNAIIQKMPGHLARLLKLYYLEDKSYKDICKIEKISTTTLKMRLFRSKRLFQKLSTEL